MNRVFVNQHDIVEIAVIGDQSADSVNAMAEKGKKLLEKQAQAGKPLVVLDNLLEMGKVTPEGRRQAAEQTKAAEFDKLAMVGNKTALRLAANLVLQATGKGEKVRYFDDYDAAIKWLKR